MVFKVLFLVLIVLLLLCMISAIRTDRRNWGYIFICTLVIATDVLCYFLVESSGIRAARSVLVVYYASHCWFCFFTLWMIIFSGRHRVIKLMLIPSGMICLFQTCLILLTLRGHRFISYSKHILWGRSWWVATPAIPESSILDFNIYNKGFIVNVVIILAVSVVCILRSPKLYRGKYYIFLFQQIAIAVVESTVSVMSLPVWINAVIQTVMCFSYLYFINSYSIDKLRTWSLRSFANEMSDGFVLYDEYDRLVHMNDVMIRKLPKDLISSFSDRKKMDEWLDTAINVEGLEVLCCPTDMGNTYFKVHKNELEERGIGMGAIYILHDTTESVNLIGFMKEANDSLERVARMKSDFLANMSHEIRTPMNAVIGMAEIALREPLPENVLDYLTQIQNSGKNLLNIINDILDFSKIEAGKMEIIPERYEPLSELADIANVLATRIGDKELDFYVSCSDQIPRVLEGDSMRIRQIIINLANNAIKFTRQGVVVIRVGCEKKSEDEVIMSYHIEDTGVGIKQEDLTKLFVSFQQVDSKRNRSVEGTGLGLAISQRLCEAMGGKLEVKSEYGKGSDFYFSIPQKVIDGSLDLKVKDAENKYVYCLSENDNIADAFLKGVNRFGVRGSIINDLAEYAPMSDQDFVFFSEYVYTDELRDFLRSHDKVTGVILVAFASDFESDLPNLRIMRRPETTLGMVNILNNLVLTHSSNDAGGAFVIDFTTPEARFLIVDDNAINITIAKGLLAPLKASCDGALSAREAIRMLNLKDYDLIFMDHMMPEMDGVEATEVIRRDIHRADGVPIIALSANAMEEAREMFRNAGMNDFVAKPIDVRSLISCVKRWLPKEKIVDGVADGQDQGALTSVSYEGLDSVNAIDALGSADLYQKIVCEYYRSGQEKYALIQRAYDEEDWEDYAIKVHALKSSSRQIGALELGDMAQELEYAGKAEDVDTIRSKTEALLKTYRDLLDSLSVYFKEEKKDDSQLTPISDEELSAVLDELSVACENLDMDVMEDVAARLKEYSFGDRTDEVNDLLHAMDNLDTEECLKIISDLQSRPVCHSERSDAYHITK